MYKKFETMNGREDDNLTKDIFKTMKKCLKLETNYNIMKLHQSKYSKAIE